MRAREVAGPDRPVEAWRALAIVARTSEAMSAWLAPTLGRRGMGAVPRVHADEGSHHLVLGDDDRSREASLAMKESTRQVKAVSA
jgi:hypothetical protein